MFGLTKVLRRREVLIRDMKETEVMIGPELPRGAP